MAKCIKCGKKAVYENNTLVLCKPHFLENVENKVDRTIRHHQLIQQKDIVCVAASGGKDSLTALYLTKKHCEKHGIRFFALCIDEGIKGYRDHTLDDLKNFCNENKIELHIVSFKDKFGSTLDSMIKKAVKKLNKKPCTVCGILRRTLINREAKRLKATKLVTGHNLDDEAQSYIMNLFLGNMRHNASLGPITGLNENKGFVTRVKPLYFVAEKETRLYALLRGFKVSFNECPNINLSFRAIVRDHLNEIEQQLPGAKNSIVNSFLEVLPELKSHYSSSKSFRECKRCGDPSAGDVCNACKLEEELCKEATEPQIQADINKVSLKINTTK